MKKIILLITLMLAGQVFLSAQRDETLFGNNTLDLTGVWYSWTQNFSFFEDDTEYFGGGSIDFEFGKSLTIGWAWQRMKDFSPLAESSREFKMKHRGFQIAYSPNAGRAIHPRVGVYAGRGRIELDGEDVDRIFGITPSGGVELNVTSWFRLGAEAGYRFVTDVDVRGRDSSDFSTPFAQLQLRFGFSWDYW